MPSIMHITIGPIAVTIDPLAFVMLGSFVFGVWTIIRQLHKK